MAIAGVIKGQKKPWRMCLYGPPGIGKSTFGAESDSPIFVTTEDGVDNLHVDQFPKAQTWPELLENCKKVLRDKHNNKTLVLDALNGAAELCAKMICDTQFKGVWIAEDGRRGFNSFASGWNATSEEMRSLIGILDDCRDKRGMNILLLAHIGIHTVNSPISGEYSKFAPEIDKRVWARWSKWCDIILRADYDYVILPGKDKTKKGHAEGTNDRVVFASGDASQDAKTRAGYELPDRLNLSYADFASALGSDSACIASVKELWPLLDSEAEKKAMAYLGVKSVSEIESAELTKLRATLNRLRQIQAKSMAEKQEGNE